MFRVQTGYSTGRKAVTSRTACRSELERSVKSRGNEMAKRSRTQITQSLALVSWLYWQILRRQPSYIAAVASCKQQCVNLEESEDSRRRFGAQQVLSAIQLLEQYCWTGDRPQDDVAVSMMIDDG